MAKNIDNLAKRLGARVVGSVPDVGGGAFGMARLAGLIASLRERTQPGQGHLPDVPISTATQRKLERLAELISTPDHKVSPIQVAAQLLDDAVDRLLPVGDNGDEAAAS